MNKFNSVTILIFAFFTFVLAGCWGSDEPTEEEKEKMKTARRDSLFNPVRCGEFGFLDLPDSLDVEGYIDKRTTPPEFVFVDRTECLHLIKDCRNLGPHVAGGSDNSFDYGGVYQIKLIKLKELRSYDFEYICNCCVSIKAYKSLMKICEDNDK